MGVRWKHRSAGAEPGQSVVGPLTSSVGAARGSGDAPRWSSSCEGVFA